MEKVENPNNNKSQLLIFTQKIKEPLSTRVNACLEASNIYQFMFNPKNFSFLVVEVNQLLHIHNKGQKEFKFQIYQQLLKPRKRYVTIFLSGTFYPKKKVPLF